jgi:hypothetical protein
VDVASCEACRRPVALARPTCAYCGAVLRTQDLVRPTESEVAPQTSVGTAFGRELLVLSVNGKAREGIAQALGITLWEAGQVLRRGGDHLLGSYAVGEGDSACERLARLGFRTLRIPEGEVRLVPRRALGGGWRDGRLVLHMAEGRVLEVQLQELLLLVLGPIARAFQTNAEPRKVRFHEVSEGYRFHLHLRESAPPVELDPEEFEFFREALVMSAILEMREWFACLPQGVTRDEAFRLETPALSPAVGFDALPVAGRPFVRRSARKDGPVVLDNLAQFRFYSGWRGAAERRR